jgi:hypothetical protein
VASKPHLTQVTAELRTVLSAHRLRALVSRRRSERSDAPARSDDESGAVLILALVFLVAVSLIVTALLTWVGTSLSATGTFQNERNVELALTDGVNLAIQNTRFQFDTGSPTAFLNNPSPELCATYQVPAEASNNFVNVYCSMVWQPFSANTRVFTYSACAYTTTPTSSTPAADCAAQPQLQDIVAFYDYPPGAASPSPNPTPCTPIQSINNSPGNGSCGETMTQVSWQWSPVVPEVNSISPSSGPTSGGTIVTIQGTGFTSGSTVNFVQQGVTGTTYNAPVAATVSTSPAPGCAVPTCVQVTAPAIVAGTNYFVTVSTPGGTSQTTASRFTSFVPTFTYNAVTPTVTGLVGTSAGSTIGNTTITIQGTGFWNASNNPQFPAQVFFCPTGGGSCVAGSVVSILPPPANSTLDTMTALTPSVSTAGSYYVQVEVFNLYSSLVNAPVFTYSVQVPIIVSMSSTNGTCPAANGTCNAGPGSQITITGANFLTGTGTCPATTQTCVALYLNNGGNQSGNAINVPTTVTNSTTITFTVPTNGLTVNAQYFPVVSLPSSFGVPSSQPYNEPADLFTFT